ncbi:DUF167 domain-containing protein [Nitrococcus mobilis]|uniref:UPF0235 protein NB231_13261 n=1 Tax=Nitrococcus mobilis Nb-231 TaxID=314278 RepID=A4BSA5_9GAMM|nr:DUF167 domain-containing protein [Nitrococcus mobilis]EAR21365.1 hypothetical protein NB231_13261 [Nitrococcus mobilis Nb-231]
MVGWRWQGTDLILTVRVQPRAARDELKIDADGRLRLRITAPPVEGKANEHLRHFLGHALGVARSQVSVATGATSRNKRIVVQNADPAKALALGLPKNRE